LIRKGASLSDKDKSGRTPFDLAKKYRHIETAQLVMQESDK
jgi:ankyrin repeat protein